MDVPFISSGAMSRAHYAVVRKVESAASVQEANQALLAEVKEIRQRLARSSLTLKQCKESLVILLYCFMTVTPGFLAKGTFEFALPHALNLAESATTVEDKRIGYLFCAEVMLSEHELQLMLVNTLCKDLAGPSVGRICLALDSLIIVPNEDIIPAVQSRLHDLLSHNHHQVRRRALLAFRSLSRHNPELLTRIAGKILKRIKDPELSVASAAIAISAGIPDVSNPFQQGVQTLREPQTEPLAPRIRATINELLRTSTINQRNHSHWFLVRILQTLCTLGLSQTNVPVALDLIASSTKTHNMAVLLGAFRLLSKLNPQELASAETSRTISCIGTIRNFLNSRHPNDVYLFLSCLECIEPTVWAGILPDYPAVLEAWEVERVMQLLDSPDNLIRAKTLTVLHKVDPDIVSAHYSRALQSILPGMSASHLGEYASRFLEVLEIQCREDGELYARQVNDLFALLEQNMDAGGHPVLENALETILVHIRTADPAFRVACTATLLTLLTESESSFGPTLMVIMSALATEYCSTVSIAPQNLLSGLSSRLKLCTSMVQDACLIAMLRISADCAEIHNEINQAVINVRDMSGRHIQRRCNQFLTLSKERQVILQIIQNARLPTLPDFAEALQKHESGTLQPRTDSPGRPSFSSSPRSTSRSTTNALRYAAYDAPLPALRLRGRRQPSPQRSVDGSHSGSIYDEPLSRTMTPGDLALAAGSRELEAITKPGIDASRRDTGASDSELENVSSRVNLITLDSPFVSEPSESLEEDESHERAFEDIWESLADSSGARGWYNGTIETVVRRLQGLERHHLKVTSADVPPFIGELKIVVSPGNGVVRLRESEEDGCLWRMRCEDGALRIRIKRLMTEDD